MCGAATSRHEGVSCDSCMKGNFRGRRFKCLICYDYDLCSGCWEQGASTPRHAATHPMQCILTRSDSDLYFGAEAALAAGEAQHSFTCPFCSKMGYTETTLQVRGRGKRSPHPQEPHFTSHPQKPHLTPPRSMYLVYTPRPARRWSALSAPPSLAETPTM